MKAADEARLWRLPTPEGFLEDLAAAARKGGAAIVAEEASTPPGLTDALRLRLRDAFAISELRTAEGELPLTALMNELGLEADFEALAQAEGQLVLVDGRSGAAAAAWSAFLTRFARRRDAAGPAVLFLAPPNFPKTEAALMEWPRLRRVDALIWAEYNAARRKDEVFSDLAVNLAVELCGWRLDLAAALLAEGDKVVLDPRPWLRRNLERRRSVSSLFNDGAFRCPLDLCAQGGEVELDRRIWRAQLTVVFPWIEERRLRIIERHHKKLRIDEHARALGVETVEDLELGALKWNLYSQTTSAELAFISALTAMRNDLAHRKPIAPEAFLSALTARREFEKTL